MRHERLVVGTGAGATIPPPAGIDLAGVHVVHPVDHARSLPAAIDGGARRIVVIGAGHIGVEPADALTAAASRSPSWRWRAVL